MYKMKLSAIFILSIVLIINFSCSSDYGKITETKEYEYDSSKYYKVKIVNINGDVVVDRTTSDKVKIKVTKRSHFNILDKVDIDKEKGDSIKFETKYQNSLYEQQIDVQYEVSIPDNVEVYVMTIYGDVDIEDVKYIDSIEVTYGDIKVEIKDLKEDITISTTNGDIKAKIKDDIYDDIEASTGLGEIKYEDISDTGDGIYDIELTSKCGDITISEL